MTGATEFLDILNSNLSPLVDRERTVIATFKSSKGFTPLPGHSSIAVNFINLPQERHKERRGGGAESENNRMLFGGRAADEQDLADMAGFRRELRRRLRARRGWVSAVLASYGLRLAPR